MSERRTVWRRVVVVLAVIAVLGSLGVTARVGAALLDAEHWLTPPRELHASGWEHDRCAYRVQNEIRAIVTGERAWTVCPPSQGDAMPSGGLAQIDPAAGVLRTKWAIGPNGPRMMNVEAALPDPEGRLGIVYRASEAGRGTGLAAGIAGPDGWVCAPALVDEHVRHTVLGLAWVDGALEVALRRPGPPAERLRGDPFVVRVPLDGAMQQTSHSRATLCGDLGSMCTVYEAYRPPGEPWRFVISGVGRFGDGRSIDDGGLGDGTRGREGDGDDVAWLWTVAADGTDRRPMRDEPFEHSGRDMAVAGMPNDMPPDMTGYVLRPDGTWAEPKPPPGRARQLTAQTGVFEVRDGVLRTRLRYIGRDATSETIAREVDGTWIAVERRRSAPPSVAVGVGGASPRRVAHASNPHVHDGLVLDRTGGGYYLATPGGYVTLDAQGRRLDALGPFEHLRAVRSSAATAAWWALVGLVPCLLLAFAASALLERIVARLSGRERRGWRARWASAVLVGAAAHALSALVLLADFWKAIP